jgi:predicted nucleic acid-binding protein
VAYLLRFDLDAQVDFLRWAHRGGIVPVDLSRDDLNQAIAVLKKYADMPADFADASLVAIADRLGIREIATYDSDFRVYRYRRRSAFVMLLPGCH